MQQDDGHSVGEEWANNSAKDARAAERQTNETAPAAQGRPRGLLPQGVHWGLPDGRLPLALTTFAGTPQGKRSLASRLEEAHSQPVYGSSSGSRLSCWGEASVLSDLPNLPFL